MHITKLTVLEYLGVGAFKCDRFGKFNILTGKNRIGKSSVLKAITEGFKSSGKDPNVIKIDSDKAEIIIELDNSILVHRKVTRDEDDVTDNKVKVVVDGQPLEKPQAFLNALLGPNQFNPVDFYQSAAKERRELLLKAIFFQLSREGLAKQLGEDAVLVALDQYDFSKHGIEVLEKIRTDIYDKRREQGQHVTRLTKALEQDTKDLPEVVDQEALASFNYEAKLEEMVAARESIAEHNSMVELLKEKRLAKAKSLQKITDIEAKIEFLKRSLEEAQQSLEQAHKDADAIQEEGVALKARLDAFEPPDIGGMETELANYRSMQSVVIKLEEIEKRRKALEDEKVLHTRLDDFYKRLTGDIPRACLAAIKLPIKGLTFEGDDILINGVSVDKMSTSEQISFAVRLARELAGKLKVICIDRFESLDPEARAAFELEAKDDEFEYFMTQVTSGDLALEQRGTLNRQPSIQKETALETGPVVASSGNKKRVTAPAPTQSSVGF